MVWPNEEARDYQFRFDLGEANYSRDETGWGISYTATWEWTLGVPFSASAPKRGVQLVVTSSIAVGEPAVSPVESYEIRLKTWWAADQVWTGSVWLAKTTDFPIRVEVDGLVLNVAGCDTWDVALDDLRLYLDGVEEYSSGAQSDSGTGYDVRDNRVKWDNDRNINPVTLPWKPDCNADAHDIQVPLAIEGGYRYAPEGTTAWVYDPVTIDAYPVPDPAPKAGCPACDCDTPDDLPRPEFAGSHVAGQDSWHLRLQAQDLDVVRKPLFGTFECFCDPPTAVPWIWDVYWPITQDWRRETAYCLLDPATKGVAETYKEAGAKCWCDPGDPPAGYTTTSETVDESDTRMRYYAKRELFDGDGMCCDLVQAGTCPPASEEFPNPTAPTCEECSGAADPDHLCIYDAYAKIEHPTEPDCISGFLSYDVSPSMRHARALVDAATDEVSLQAGQNTRPRISWGTAVAAGFDAADGSLRWVGSTGVLGLLYATPAGAVEYRTTPDEGLSWSAASSVGSGTRAALLVGRNQELFQYWRDAGALKGRILDAAGNVLVATFTVAASGVDDAPIAADEDFAHGGQWRVLLRWFSGGVLSELHSPDGQSFSS